MIASQFEFKVYSAHEVGLNDLSFVDFEKSWNSFWLNIFIYTTSKKKESISVHSTLLARFLKPLFVLKYSTFQEKILQKVIVRDFTLPLTPFESKLTD